MSQVKFIRAFSVGFIAVASYGLPQAAHAQMSAEPWGFSAQNRVSVASLIKQVEDQEEARNSVTSAAVAPGNITNLVCGSDGQSSAAGTSACIIISNAEADIDLAQDSDGNATAATDESIDVGETSDTLADIIESMSGS